VKFKDVPKEIETLKVWCFCISVLVFALSDRTTQRVAVLSVLLRRQSSGMEVRRGLAVGL
jgi:hypothetical protein